MTYDLSDFSSQTLPFSTFFMIIQANLFIIFNLKKVKRYCILMKIASLLGCLSGQCNISLFDLAEPSIYKLVCVKLFFWQNWEDTWFSLDSSLCNSKHRSVLLDWKRRLGSRLKSAAVIHKMLKGLCSQGSWDHKFFFNFSFFVVQV